MSSKSATRPTQKPLSRWTFLLVVIAVVVAACASAMRRADTAPEASAGVFRYDADGMRYEYHAPTGVESLFDLRGDPEADVIADHRGVAREYRKRLEERLGVADLDVLRERHAETIRRLHALGYL